VRGFSDIIRPTGIMSDRGALPITTVLYDSSKSLSNKFTLGKSATARIQNMVVKEGWIPNEAPVTTLPIMRAAIKDTPRATEIFNAEYQLAELTGRLKPTTIRNPFEYVNQNELLGRKIGGSRGSGYDNYISQVSTQAQQKAINLGSPKYGMHGQEHATSVYNNLMAIRERNPSLQKYSPDIIRTVAEYHDIFKFENAPKSVDVQYPHGIVAAEAIGKNLVKLPRTERLSAQERMVVAEAIRGHHDVVPTFDLAQGLRAADQLDLVRFGTAPKLSIKDVRISDSPITRQSGLTVGQGLLNLVRTRFTTHRIGGSFAQGIQMSYTRPFADLDFYVPKGELPLAKKIIPEYLKQQLGSEAPKMDIHELAPVGADVGRYGVKVQKDITVEGLNFMPISEQALRKITQSMSLMKTDSGYAVGPGLIRGKDIADVVGISKNALISTRNSFWETRLKETSIQESKGVIQRYMLTKSYLPESGRLHPYTQATERLAEYKLSGGKTPYWKKPFSNEYTDFSFHDYIEGKVTPIADLFTQRPLGYGTYATIRAGPQLISYKEQALKEGNVGLVKERNNRGYPNERVVDKEYNIRGIYNAKGNIMSGGYSNNPFNNNKPQSNKYTNPIYKETPQRYSTPIMGYQPERGTPPSIYPPTKTTKETTPTYPGDIKIPTPTYPIPNPTKETKYPLPTIGSDTGYPNMGITYPIESTMKPTNTITTQGITPMGSYPGVTTPNEQKPTNTFLQPISTRESKTSFKLSEWTPTLQRSAKTLPVLPTETVWSGIGFEVKRGQKRRKRRGVLVSQFNVKVPVPRLSQLLTPMKFKYNKDPVPFNLKRSGTKVIVETFPGGTEWLRRGGKKL
jgi:hypothetical protein